LRLPLYAFILIIILWLAILFTIIKFYKITKPAAYLLIPYIMWVSFASVLNFYIWLLNK
jgi:tryptophan-rich sensory protein